MGRGIEVPVQQGVGYNRHSTPRKQFALNGALGHLLGASVSVAEKWNSRCIALDMTCGPGADDYGLEGSPLILAKQISKWIDRGHRIELWCIDRESAHLDRLEARMRAGYPQLTVRYYGDQKHALQSLPKGAIGLSYWDPTRYNDLDIELLKWHGRQHKFVDVLLTRECLAGHRMRRAGLESLTIQEYLALTGKACNYIMQFADWGWWSFGFADNWTSRPREKMKGFYNVESPEGMRRWKWLEQDEPAEESDDDQGRLF